MSRISVRGFAVASATAVTTVGAVVGVASGSEGAVQPVAAADATTVLADIPAGQQVQQASLTQQVQAQSDAADASAKKAAQEAARKQAAKDAAARKKAEEKAAEKAEAARKAEEASRAAKRAALVVKASYTVAEVQAMAQGLIGNATQYQCFSNIVTRESGWNYTATNASSGAYGLVQALPGSKMASAGADWRTNPGTQIKWGLNYMNSRYGSPCGAWSFWQANHWY
ncbi:transglycosylase SLT domain-containing protein [Actinacidiphila sp. bgisy167]|uniref:aggregation-promoting factor C-terminal-like domain-containing protein n=1 Tax=Actinacidiphila sp. bgisy167 TaxID=3413797 RepID=UPI003D72D779